MAMVVVSWVAGGASCRGGRGGGEGGSGSGSEGANAKNSTSKIGKKAHTVGLYGFGKTLGRGSRWAPG